MVDSRFDSLCAASRSNLLTNAFGNSETACLGDALRHALFELLEVIIATRTSHTPSKGDEVSPINQGPRRDSLIRIRWGSKEVVQSICASGSPIVGTDKNAITTIRPIRTTPHPILLG